MNEDKKRKRGQGKATPVKKRKTESEREVCKYGVKCYQSNEEHKKKFSHPWVRYGVEDKLLLISIFYL